MILFFKRNFRKGDISTRADASTCSAAVSAASFGGVPPRFYGEMSPPRTGTGIRLRQGFSGTGGAETRRRGRLRYQGLALPRQNAFFKIRRVSSRTTISFGVRRLSVDRAFESPTGSHLTKRYRGDALPPQPKALTRLPSLLINKIFSNSFSSARSNSLRCCLGNGPRWQSDKRLAPPDVVFTTSHITKLI
jgi:hypothetical protein